MVTDNTSDILNIEELDILINNKGNGFNEILELTGDLDFGCIECGDTGITSDGTPCTEQSCREKVSQMKQESLSRENDYSRFPYYIPEKYRDIEWNKEDALKDPPLYTSTMMTYNNYITLLDRILNRAKNNTLLKENIIVSASAKTTKRRWAYTLAKEVSKNGITVGGIEFIDDIYVNNIMKNQVMIIYVTRYKFKENIDKLDLILSKRQSQDKVTIVISEVGSRFFISDLDNRPIHFDIEVDFSK